MPHPHCPFIFISRKSWNVECATERLSIDRDVMIACGNPSCLNHEVGIIIVSLEVTMQGNTFNFERLSNFWIAIVEIVMKRHNFEICSRHNIFS